MVFCVLGSERIRAAPGVAVALLRNVRAVYPEQAVGCDVEVNIAIAPLERLVMDRFKPSEHLIENLPSRGRRAPM